MPEPTQPIWDLDHPHPVPASIVSEVQTSQEVISYYAKSIASELKLSSYEPDFIAVTSDGIYHLIETKGREDIDVKHKYRAAQLWCENASLLTEIAWEYQIVHQKEFEKLHPDEFSDLVVLAPVWLL